MSERDLVNTIDLINKLTLALEHVDFAMSQIAVKDPLVEADAILRTVLQELRTGRQPQ